MNHPTDDELLALEEEMRGPLMQAAGPAPSSGDTARLIASLQGEFDLLKQEALPQNLQFNPRVEPPSLLQLLRSQMRLNQKAILLVSSAVFLMLVLLIDPSYPLNQVGGIPGGIFPLITPLLLIASMLFTSRTWDPGMRAVETITPYPPALVLYSRLLTVTFIVAGMAMLSTLILGLRAMREGSVYFVFGPFVLEWMGLLLLTGGVAMYVMFRRGVIWSMISAVFVYGAWIVVQSLIQGSIDGYGAYPNMKMPVDLITFAAGAALIVFAYWYSIRNRSLPGGTAHD